MPTVYVNDKPVEIGTKKLNCIQAAELAGVFIPSYCWHEAAHRCRQLPHVSRRSRRPQRRQAPDAAPRAAGCQTPVKDGTVIVTGEYDKRDATLPALPYDPGYVKGGAPGVRAKKSQRIRSKACSSTTRSTAPSATRPASASCKTSAYSYGRSESRMVDEKNTPANKPRPLQHDHAVHRPLHHVYALRAVHARDQRHRGAVGERPRAPRGDRHVPR